MKNDTCNHPNVSIQDTFRKYASVYALIFRCTILPILTLWLAACTVMTALFLWNMNRSIPGIEDIISKSWFHQITMVCWILIIAVFQIHEGNIRTKSASQIQYTLTRLAVSEKEIFVIWTLYHLVIQLISWGILLILSYALCQFYVHNANPELINAQTIYMAFCRNSFLYNLLPLAIPYRLWINLFLLISMSIIISSDTWVLRRQKKSLNASVLGCLWVSIYSDEVFLHFSFQDTLLIFLFSGMLIWSFVRISKLSENFEY